jgi:hypothetical protein
MSIEQEMRDIWDAGMPDVMTSTEAHPLTGDAITMLVETVLPGIITVRNMCVRLGQAIDELQPN